MDGGIEQQPGMAATGQRWSPAATMGMATERRSVRSPRMRANARKMSPTTSGGSPTSGSKQSSRLKGGGARAGSAAGRQAVGAAGRGPGRRKASRKMGPQVEFPVQRQFCHRNPAAVQGADEEPRVSR